MGIVRVRICIHLRVISSEDLGTLGFRYRNVDLLENSRDNVDSSVFSQLPDYFLFARKLFHDVSAGCASTYAREAKEFLMKSSTALALIGVGGYQ